eukprot:PhM_4_TR13766/c0_g2_i1/m.88600
MKIDFNPSVLVSPPPTSKDSNGGMNSPPAYDAQLDYLVSSFYSDEIKHDRAEEERMFVTDWAITHQCRFLRGRVTEDDGSPVRVPTMSTMVAALTLILQHFKSCRVLLRKAHCRLRIAMRTVVSFFRCFVLRKKHVAIARVLRKWCEIELVERAEVRAVIDAKKERQKYKRREIKPSAADTYALMRVYIDDDTKRAVLAQLFAEQFSVHVAKWRVVEARIRWIETTVGDQQDVEHMKRNLKHPTFYFSVDSATLASVALFERGQAYEALQMELHTQHDLDDDPAHYSHGHGSDGEDGHLREPRWMMRTAEDVAWMEAHRPEPYVRPTRVNVPLSDVQSRIRSRSMALTSTTPRRTSRGTVVAAGSRRGSYVNIFSTFRLPNDHTIDDTGDVVPLPALQPNARRGHSPLHLIPQPPPTIAANANSPTAAASAKNNRHVFLTESDQQQKQKQPTALPLPALLVPHVPSAPKTKHVMKYNASSKPSHLRQSFKPSPTNRSNNGNRLGKVQQVLASKKNTLRRRQEAEMLLQKHLAEIGMQQDVQIGNQ